MQCWCCHKPANSKHHVIPKRYGGSDGDDNLIPLCLPCHGVVDHRTFLTKKMVNRIAEFPRLQILLIARIRADIFAGKVISAIVGGLEKHNERIIKKLQRSIPS